MEQESETAYKSLRQGLSSSSGINTVDEFFRLDVSSKPSTNHSLARVINGNLTYILWQKSQHNSCSLEPKFQNRSSSLERISSHYIAAPNAFTSHADPAEDRRHIHTHQFFRPAFSVPSYAKTGLVEYFIQHLDPALEPDKSFIDQKCKETLPNTAEHSMSNWITSFFEQAVKQSPNIQISRTWQSKPTMRLEGVNSTRKLDGAIMSLNLGNENHIRDVLVRVELKIKNKSEASHAAICLANSGSLSGAIGSESFDVKASKENLKKFFALISLSLTCNKRLLGFDPTFIDDQGPHTAIQIVTDTGTQELVIDHPHIFRAAGICGRGTTCWKAHLSVDERQTFLIKDSWQPKDRREEGVMLRDVTENNVPHVARYHHHEDVHVAGNSVDIESHVRRGANFQTCQTIKITDEPNDPHKYRMALLIGFTNG
ncbi:hypothetical protein PGTUg99_036504 [Puccinia graminis f. sp. tritici]|uniref:Fungal-type protein kinase domain-containing protein n=1 Tax=Puccinia graminis f. sp. tritici TaxID=56615 RepID=A0A5B0RQ19_PUCGR|nr:hypothetical protein PGTUg99_036504 [Puccinia graminis f. sp. tritici]